MSGCRIGRIKLKSGGEVVPLRVQERDDHQQRIVRHAAAIAGNFAPGAMRGFLVIGFDREGHYSLGYRLDDDCVVGRSLFPSWISDVIRRDFLEEGVW